MKFNKDDVLKLIKENRDLKSKQEEYEKKINDSENLIQLLKKELVYHKSEHDEKEEIIINLIHENRILGESIMKKIDGTKKTELIEKSIIFDENEDLDPSNLDDVEEHIRNEIKTANEKYMKDKKTYFNKIKKFVDKNKQVFYTAQSVNNMLSTGATIVKFGSYAMFLL
jgi:septum formation inhibitor MinC